MNLDIAHCIHCGRIYIRGEYQDESCYTDDCVCGAELYPVSKRLHLGELKLAEGEKARVVGVEYDDA